MQITRQLLVASIALSFVRYFWLCEPKRKYG